MLLALSLLAFFHGNPNTPVRASFGDGQVLMGEVQTRTLKLHSGAGLLEIPLADVGEVVPVATGGLGESEGRVDVWLRNGSELRGTWADPQLAMRVRVGGDDVPVDLPMNDLSRFQLQGGAAWPAGPVYRMRTVFGDDLLVDPDATTLVLTNAFGTFAPKLSECTSVGPVGEVTGPWRVELETGTVLVGKLRDDRITVALPMGPDAVTVALDQFVSLRRESWAPVATAPASAPYPYPAEDAAYEVNEGEAVAAPRVERPRPARATSEAGWFDRAPLSASKQAQGD